MFNQQSLKINEKSSNQQRETKLMVQMEVNPQFENNDEQKLNGFDFGLSEGDWGDDVNDDANDEKVYGQINKDEFEFVGQQASNEIINKSTNDNKDFDEFSAFNQDNINNNTNQANYKDKTSFFISQEEKQSKMRKKRLELQSLYSVQRSRLLNKGKAESELQQLVKYNQLSNQFNIISSNKNSITNKSYNNNTNNKQYQHDFFSVDQKSQLQQQNEFAVFDNNPSLFSQKQYYSTYIQQKDEVNSPANLINKNTMQQFNTFQTQILLSPQDSIMNSVQTQMQIKHNNIFSMKCLPNDLITIRILISVICITAISLLYGFLNSIFLITVHDFLIAPFLIKEVIKINQINNKHQVSMSKTKSQYHNVNSQIIDLNQISLDDQITHTQNSVQSKFTAFDSYKTQLQSSLKWHKCLKYTLYISSLSLFIFILIQITQIDTFFTANYFSLSNWGHIIIIALIYTVEFWSNCKLNKKIDQVMFYQDNYLQSYQIQ